MRRTDSASSLVVVPKLARSCWMAGGTGGTLAGGVAGGAWAERRGLSRRLSERIFGAALTAVCTVNRVMVLELVGMRWKRMVQCGLQNSALMRERPGLQSE